MRKLRNICVLLIMFLIFVISTSLAGLPILLSILLGSWYWLFLYSIHAVSIMVLGICCGLAPYAEEESSHII